MESKKFNITYQYSMIGTITIDVPKDMTIEEALKYAEDNIEDLPLPDNAEYISESCLLDQENCDFDE